MRFRSSLTSHAKDERWPLAHGHPRVERRRPGFRVAAGLALALALVLVASIGENGESRVGPGLPTSLRVLVAMGALVPLGWGLLGALASAREREAGAAHIVANAAGVARVADGGTKALLTWDSPCGVVLLASYGRPTALLAFTTEAHTRFVPVRVDGRTDADDATLAQVAVLADLDLVDGVAHEAALSPASTAALVRCIAKRDPAALGRVYTNDGSGVPIVVDRATLAVGDRTFDLTGPLEWRPLMFHESAGQAAALYQATWIKQNASEVVLVAPMPASLIPRGVSVPRSTEAMGRLGRTLTRDLRLLQAPTESPPARDMRVPIDRPLMMSVRRFLDEAPLAARAKPLPLPARGKLSAYS